MYKATRTGNFGQFTQINKHLFILECLRSVGNLTAELGVAQRADKTKTHECLGAF